MAKPNLQTVIVSKKVAKTRAGATKVARKYANRIYTSRETKTSWRFRQRPPKDFVQKSFRTFPVPGSPGISLVYGTLKKPKRVTNPKPTLELVRRWERYNKRASRASNLKDLAELAKKGHGFIEDERMRYVFDSEVAQRAAAFGVQCGEGHEAVTACVEELISNQNRTLFDGLELNPKLKKVPRNPKVMPNPGPTAWLGSLLEWRWTQRGTDYLWEPDGSWAFCWSPHIKGVIAIPDPSVRKRLSNVSRKGGAAKLYERFSSRGAANTYEIEIPKVKLQKLGKAGHIVYRSDKWNPGKDIDYIHDFKEGVQLFVGPSLDKPEVFLCFGGRLTCTERGLVY